VVLIRLWDQNFIRITDRMMRIVLVFLLSLLGLLHAGPLPDEPVLQTQENFDVKRVSVSFWKFKRLFMHRRPGEVFIIFTVSM